MMNVKTKATGLSAAKGDGEGEGDGGDWEMRPGGMLVQRRNPDSDRSSVPPPTITVRVKYGSVYHQIHISSEATFGELKKMLTAPTGLHHLDQKIMYKDKERDSKAFLDTAGVKDRSKIVLLEDPISQEKRLLEMRRNAKAEKISKSISDISLDIDRLAGQVSAYESVITKGGKVAEKGVLNLIELLMNQILKLDAIIGDGDVKLQRKMQVKRVQKYVETLDMLKIKNSDNSSNGNDASIQNQGKYTTVQRSVPIQQEQPRQSVGQMPNNAQQPSRNSTPGVVVTTKWETFDATPTSQQPSVSASDSSRLNPKNHKFNWELFE